MRFTNSLLRGASQMKHCLALCLLLTSFSSHAALHKWVDSAGQVHYSDTAAPPDVKSQTLRQSSQAAPIASSSAVAAPKTQAEREADQKRVEKEKAEVAQKAARQQEEAANKQKNCDAARSHLATLENTPRLVIYDAQGERSYLDDAARQQRIEEAQKTISSTCN